MSYAQPYFANQFSTADGPTPVHINCFFVTTNAIQKTCMYAKTTNVFG